MTSTDHVTERTLLNLAAVAEEPAYSAVAPGYEPRRPGRHRLGAHPDAVHVTAIAGVVLRPRRRFTVLPGGAA